MPRPASCKFVFVSRLIYWSSVKPPLEPPATIIYDNNLYSINYLYCTITSPRIELKQGAGFFFFQGKAIHSQSMSSEEPRGVTQTRSGPAVVVTVVVFFILSSTVQQSKNDIIWERGRGGQKKTKIKIPTTNANESKEADA